jgi:surface antigen
MRMKSAYSFSLLLLMVAGCASPPPFQHPFASGHYASDIEQCVPYARKVSGIEIYGDAYTWWGQAEPRYARGYTPAAGAVLVLKRTSRMRAGHVAVVKNVLGPREINVTHSNWGDSRSSRHIIYDSMLAKDVSAANDWSQVRFWNDAKGVMGFPYEAYGFIYP